MVKILEFGTMGQSAAANLSTDSLVCVHYGDPTEPGHERLLGVHLGGSRWVVATPIHDVYDEDLEELAPAGGCRTAGGFKRHDTECQWCDGVARVACSYCRAQLCLRCVSWWYQQPWCDITCLWRSWGWEDEDDGLRGLAVGKPGSVAAGGSRDRRALPVLSSTSGERKRPFSVAVSLVTETAQEGWGIEGPRTTSGLVKAIADGGHTPVQRQFWWRSARGFSASDAGLEEHLFLVDLMEVGSSFDQRSLGECAVFDAFSRRYQVWEEAYSAALRHADVGTNAEEEGLWVDVRRLFVGARRARGPALVSPLVEKHVAPRLSEEAAIRMERRQDREEKLLAKGDAVGDDKPAPKPKAKKRP